MSILTKAVMALTTLLVLSTTLVGCEKSEINQKTGMAEQQVVLEDGVADDIDVSAAVKQALQQNDQLRKFNLAVETRKGDVTLQGQVDTEEQRMLAEQTALSTAGAHTVNNEIKVKQ